jgi:hypothetical protein
MSLSFVSEEFNNLDNCVSWYGRKFHTGDELDAFLNKSVKTRLDDEKGKDDFNSCLNDLKLTGMGHDCLQKVLSTEIQESRDWKVGEAIAEAWLIENNGIIFPWNIERDKRNPFASLPGADLIGFVKDNDSYRLVLGEVKTSSENKSPPQVMLGRSGMEHQLDNLADDMSLIHQVLLWLFHRTQNEIYRQAYESSCVNYFNSQCKDVLIFGILIRDTNPNELDLSGRGKKFRIKLNLPTQCHLIALYLPWCIEELNIRLRRGVVK